MNLKTILNNIRLYNNSLFEEYCDCSMCLPKTISYSCINCGAEFCSHNTSLGCMYKDKTFCYKPSL